jgi:hypothetical protein
MVTTMRRSVLLLAILLVTSTIAHGRPAYAVGNPGGASLDCVPGSPQLIVSHGTLTRVAGGGTLSCPPPGAAPGHSFGQTNYPPPTPPTPGTKCHMEYQSPMQFQLGNGMYLGNIHDPQGNPPPQWTSNGFQNLDVLPSDNSLGKVEDLYKAAGTNDVYTPWVFDGIWNAQGQCVSQVPPSPQNPAPGWTSPCRINGTGTWPGCLNLVPVFVGGQQAPAGLLGENLTALVQGHYTGGAITSLPDAPQHPGLTNLPTCFYVSNMTVDGQPANPQVPTVWEKVVVGPNAVDAQGRHIVYVFRITVSYQQTVWNFGDGTGDIPVGPGGQLIDAGGLPGSCGRNANQQFLVTHTYHKYSTVADGFHVTVRHRYGIRVDEAWLDSAGSHVVNDIPTGVGPVDVLALPQPYYPMPVIQEEGVPVGG